jgi:hypothetical protein
MSGATAGAAAAVVHYLLREEQRRRDDGGSSPSDCFIATVVYGNKQAPQVETLRQYRDNVLMQSAPGRAFVDFYYSGAGRKAAELIKEKLPGTIPTIRKGLDWLVDRYTAEHQN